MTEDHARVTVSKEMEINVIHTLFLHLNHMSFILAGNLDYTYRIPNIDNMNLR